MNNYELTLVHLYPQEMNIYGDRGNIICLQKRCERRNITFHYQKMMLTDRNQIESEPSQGDIYFMGGGQDNDMYRVFEDLLNNKLDFIRSEFENNKVFLLICGAFQLFGSYFLDSSGREIKGLDLLPLETKAPGDKLADRCLGNSVARLTPQVHELVEKHYQGTVQSTIVGFENHSGQTYFTNENMQPLGEVIAGKGNNSLQGIEGGKMRNIFASYMHGSFLPKNPHLADTLISLALNNKYKEEIKLEALDDEVEWAAHRAVLDKLAIGL